MGLYVHSASIEDDHDLIGGVADVAEWSLWVLVDDWDPDSTISPLLTAFAGLRAIIWYTSGTAWGRLRAHIAGQGKERATWPALAANLVSEVTTAYSSFNTTTYSRVAWASGEARNELGKLISRSGSGSSNTTLAYIPNSPEVAADWSNIVYGLSWLEHCRNWIGSEPKPLLNADGVLLSYIGLTIKIGGVAGLLVRNLDAPAGDPKNGIVMYGRRSILEAATRVLSTAGDPIDKDDFNLWFHRGATMELSP
jgi:hypothetical protein